MMFIYVNSFVVFKKFNQFYYDSICNQDYNIFKNNLCNILVVYFVKIFTITTLFGVFKCYDLNLLLFNINYIIY